MANWVRVETRFPNHPKVLDIGPIAESLWLRGLCYAGEHLTDGFIPSSFVRRMADMKGSAMAARLVGSGLWSEVEGGYQIHDYLEWQTSKDDVADIASKRAEAGRKGGKQRAANAQATGKQIASTVLQHTPSKTQPDIEVEVEGIPLSNESGASLDSETSSGPPSSPTSSIPYLILEAVCREQGVEVSVLSPRQKSRELGVAKRLADDGTTPDDIRAVTRWLLGQPWVKSGVDLALVESKIGSWRIAGSPASARASPSTGPTPWPADIPPRGSAAFRSYEDAERYRLGMSTLPDWDGTDGRGNRVRRDEPTEPRGDGQPAAGERPAAAPRPGSRASPAGLPAD